jgi:two-component system chemotaxis response regulator CheB
MIRVVVVEDSATARALLVEILASDPQLKVVGEACDGLEGVELTQRIRPDVVTMDLNMPRLDGFGATKEIMITAPTPIVIATNSTKAAEVEVAMHALRAGAVAVVCKPHGPGTPGFEESCAKFLSTVKGMAGVKVVRRWRTTIDDRTAKSPPDKDLHGEPGRVPARTANRRARVVAIASSTGGPAALQTLLAELPGDFPVPILVVQHIALGFTAGLAAWLNSVCDLRVKVAESGEKLAAHTVYIAPDGKHLGASSPHHVLLDDGPPIGGFRPSGTFLFESLAKTFGSGMAAVILTGMGDDGVEGLRAVRYSGGRCLVQDEKSSVVFGMPGAAVAAGLADLVAPPEQIAARLIQLV